MAEEGCALREKALPLVAFNLLFYDRDNIGDGGGHSRRTAAAACEVPAGAARDDKAVIAGLASSGVEALAIAAAATAGSVVAARVVYRRFFEHRKTAAGHEE